MGKAIGFMGLYIVIALAAGLTGCVLLDKARRNTDLKKIKAGAYNPMYLQPAKILGVIGGVFGLIGFVTLFIPVMMTDGETEKAVYWIFGDTGSGKIYDIGKMFIYGIILSASALVASVTGQYRYYVPSLLGGVAMVVMTCLIYGELMTAFETGGIYFTVCIVADSGIMVSGCLSAFTNLKATGKII